ncbi:PREDICTED: interferon epsilon-like [Gavialis gangeticus]|uniref:interferon epsilon-like n=1 Tax=Gavialis gangeticus TaxID=94835 RepID=UPI00092EBCC0|nr:PREDICTED: interferon epsilon-like [Gavialis gangeticus]
MSTMRLLHICLILLFSTEISSQHCDLLSFQQKKLNKDSLELLEKMGGNFPFQCFNEGIDFKSMQDVLKLQSSQKENAKLAIQNILQEIFTVFSKNLTQTAWDTISIITFQNKLHQQIERLEACLGSLKEKDGTKMGSDGLVLTKLKVKRFFQGIYNFLEEKQYSQCAWEIIHMEITRCFLFVDQLTKSL